jgi:hypothetical protein
MAIPTIITDSARLMAERRVKKLGHKKLSNIAQDAARTKVERYGPNWPARVRRGEKLEPLPAQESE